jgi:hypothetical protein
MGSTANQSGRGAVTAERAVDQVTRAIRRLRATQLDEVHTEVSGGGWARAGLRSPTDWLLVTSNETCGQCRLLVRLAEWIQKVPAVRTTFASGDLSESALRLLADTWTDANAAAFERDEQMLLGWALRLPYSDLRMLLDTWKRHSDPDRETATDRERFESRHLDLTEQHDGMGRDDGLLDPKVCDSFVRRSAPSQAEPSATSAPRDSVAPMPRCRWPAWRCPTSNRCGVASAPDRR